MLTTFTRWMKFRNHLALSTFLAGAAALPAAAQTVYGLSTTSSPAGMSLVTFAVTTPGTFTATAAITGLGTGQTLVGLDSRPNTGQLFALGYVAATTQVQLYTVNVTTGALTAVGPLLTLNLGTNTARIGFDFNPTVDRIRVTGSNNANFRLNPSNGALAAPDGNLAYAATDANAAQTPGVGSVAYGNSFIGATNTVLYDIDEANSRYTTQDPPNSGTLNSRTALTVNTATALATDLDIYFNPTTRTNGAYLTIATGTAAAPTTQLYTLDFITGASMTAVGAVGPAGTLVTDIAFAIARPATQPAVTGQLAYALAGTNLLTFDTALPTSIRTSVGITGVDATQTLAGLDVRPATNTLYALGYNAAAATGVANAQIYALNSLTGVATAAGPAVRLELGTGSIGFDFNPTVDRLRVVAGNRANYRLNPNDGTIAATDGTLAYATGPTTPSIGAAAYTNSFMGATATSGTTLYDYDELLNTLNTQLPPNDGTLNSVGASGITVNATTPNVDLDIYSTGVATNTAYLVANTGTSANTSLYTVNLTTGAATLVGAIGNGLAARDIAVAAATGVVTAARPTELATDFGLYPNPVAGAASVSFGLPRAAHVELVVTDALGRTVDKIDVGQLPAGTQTIRWSRQSQAAGMYFFRLRFDGQPAGTRQAVLLGR